MQTNKIHIFKYVRKCVVLTYHNLLLSHTPSITISIIIIIIISYYLLQVSTVNSSNLSMTIKITPLL